MERLAMVARKGRWQLDNSMQSKIMNATGLFAIEADIERALISQRTKEALWLKKASGMRLGCPRGPGKSKLDPYQLAITTLFVNGATQTFIVKPDGTTEGNVHTWLRKCRLRPL